MQFIYCNLVVNMKLLRLNSRLFGPNRLLQNQLMFLIVLKILF